MDKTDLIMKQMNELRMLYQVPQITLDADGNVVEFEFVWKNRNARIVYEHLNMLLIEETAKDLKREYDEYMHIHRYSEKRFWDVSAKESLIMLLRRTKNEGP